MIYLDYAAATPLDPEVKKSMAKAEQNFANPSATYGMGANANAELEQARQTIARILNCQSGEVIFTSGGTESDNLAIFGIAQNIPRGSKLITIETEHKSVLEPLERLSQKNFELSFAKVDTFGMVDPKSLTQEIDDKTALVAIALASSEIGTIQSVSTISQIIKQKRADRIKRGITLPLYWHCDGSAGAEFLNLHVDRLGVYTLSLNSAKLYGPKGNGVLYIKRGVNISPQLLGGGQEFGLRAGTQNLAGAVGFATALQKAQRLKSEEKLRLASMSKNLLAQLRHQFPNLILNGHPTKRLPQHLSISLPGLSGETLVDYFNTAGIAVATGAACTAADSAPSRALLTLGLSEDLAQSSLRITLGRPTSNQELKKFVKAFTTITHELSGANF